ncbi:hypothetical protein VE03_00842 [Pseudogymnoascus sp. 23342-1-I1]|nr:hypothetical protein VE03_00842 [Pseudogymnoascus sp. 23342-1-I1]
MSKGRAFIPVVLAAGFGVANALWAFGPAFEEQAQERAEKARRQADGDKPLDEEVTASIKAAADASRSEATAEALQSKPDLWQTAAKFWDKPSNVSKPTNETSQTVTKGQKPDESPRTALYYVRLSDFAMEGYIV